MINLPVSDISTQIPLNFKNTDIKSFKDFIVGKNLIVLDSLQSFPQSDEYLFYLWGKSANGKSHLLQAFIAHVTALGKTAVILKPDDISQRQNISLLTMFDYICIDAVENIVANSLLEEALFFWINEVRAADKKIILASQVSNKSQQWQLPDLQSRLQAGRTHEIKSLDRGEALQVFTYQAKQKGIVVDTRMVNYLNNNCPMNMQFLSLLLNALDETTLIQKKQLTMPFLKKILATVLVK
ncbi:hypothetical protein MNBD_GAMMA01-1772 [hydrothermal vent metagenome]|uniref:Hda lid domain-containing protein n=1 Tax=hydrothermal vent metagenome TaxID=652676 RepID=A0A3B0V6J3_9ZZZZ